MTIQRDGFGVPFINGVTFDDVEYGAGYAAIEDRMFLMDVLRHTGAARMAEFVGNTPGNVAMDQAQLRSAYYTPAEANAQIAKAAADAGAHGQKLLGGVDAFLAGINQAQHDLCPIVAAPTCPAEYVALQKVPTDWTRADIVYIASLVGGIFGKGGGNEVQNAKWWQALKARFGKKQALKIYGDLREKNDPEAPTTSSRSAPYDGTTFDPGLPGVALPDRNGATAPGTGAALRGSARAAPGKVKPRLDLPNGVSVDLSQLGAHGMSNALLVTGKESRTGKPLAVMGPQTGYYAPQLLVEQVLNGPGIQARGVAFAGTNLFVQLGRGVDYAWSATSAGSDNIDTVVEKLCNTDGSKADGELDRLPGRQEVRADAVGRALRDHDAEPHRAGPATTYKFQVLRTRHGIVQQRTTVGGKPVALVIQRSTYGHEIDSVLGFSEFNDPGFVHDAKSFQKAASDVDYTFNWFYADSKDISYYSSGLLPKRSTKVEPDLPHWAGKKYDWKGWLTYKRHARETNPKRGYLVSWNNKPAPDFSAADDNWSYGAVYRSLALEKRLAAEDQGQEEDRPARHGRGDGRRRHRGLAGGVHAAVAAQGDRQGPEDRRPRGRADAVAEGRGTACRPGPRRRLRVPGRDRALRLVVGGRLPVGGVRRDVRPARTAGAPAAADPRRPPAAGRWLVVQRRRLVRLPLQGPPLGAREAGRAARTPRATAARARSRPAARRCGRRWPPPSPGCCSEQGKSSVAQLTYDKAEDDIRASTAGVVGVRPIDWQNRPTFQQVIEFFGHR